LAESCDFLVIGSGLAGLRFALEVAPHGKVFVITKRAVDEGNTRYAQGGIAAAWTHDDSWEDHERDTLVAGAGLCRREVVARTVREAKDRVSELIALGVGFDERDGGYDLHREGGHSNRRILHTKDLTGAEIMRALVERAKAHPNIVLREQHMAIDLITEGWLARRQGDLPPARDRVLGAYVLDTVSGEVATIAARVTALCTGGAGKVYLYTTNPDIASGDGIAMGYRAGARVANMEFVQFHPTCLYHPDARNFLVTEAMRGEGGILRLENGEPFMARYDPGKELAPRDIVARAIDAELKRTGDDCVYLDMTHLGADALIEKFPNVHATCLQFGIDITDAPIPVVPAAHYFCGGVVTDLSGETDIQNLFAIGETACTGLHGANRLASNSLLEAASFAYHAGRAAIDRLPSIPARTDLPPWDPGKASQPDEQVVISQVWDEIRRFMWNYVGIVRTNRRLARARMRIDFVQDEIQRYYWDFAVTGDLVELRNLATVAQCVVDCALQRRESRGLHFTLDYPDADKRFIADSVVQRRF
jgi:L-aspartate oxidase